MFWTSGNWDAQGDSSIDINHKLCLNCFLKTIEKSTNGCESDKKPFK